MDDRLDPILLVTRPPLTPPSSPSMQGLGLPEHIVNPNQPVPLPPGVSIDGLSATPTADLCFTGMVTAARLADDAEYKDVSGAGALLHCARAVCASVCVCLCSLLRAWLCWCRGAQGVSSPGPACAVSGWAGGGPGLHAHSGPPAHGMLLEPGFMLPHAADPHAAHAHDP